MLNQKICRMLLSVHKKTSRLAVLGEFGRYPMLVPALKLCLKYNYSIETSDKNSLIYKAFNEMKKYPELDCWYSRVCDIKSLLDIKRAYGPPHKVGCMIDKSNKSKFDIFFLDQINQIKTGNDGQDHNKLRLYKKLKGSFTQEPYLCKIPNRNQRTWLSRFRTSAHNFRVESGRHTSPVTQFSDRVCTYCDSGEIDTELHGILMCNTFVLKRQCFLSRVSEICPLFDIMPVEQQLITLLCPATAELAKCVSKYLGIISDTRKEIDNGLNRNYLLLYIKHKV